MVGDNKDERKDRLPPKQQPPKPSNYGLFLGGGQNEIVRSRSAFVDQAKSHGSNDTNRGIFLRETSHPPPSKPQ